MLSWLTLLGLAAAEPNLLEGCRARKALEGFQYECDTMQISVVDDARISPALFRGAEKGVAAVFGPESERRETRLTVGGRTVEAIVLTDAAGERTAILVKLKRPEGERMLVCVGGGGDGSSCRPVLDLLARAGWRSGPVGGAVLEEARPLVLGGREVEVEEGCVGEIITNGGRIHCGPGSFALWVGLEDEEMARRAVDTFLAEAAAAMERGSSPVKRDDVPCAIGGSPTTCIRMRGEDAGRPFVFVVGSADVGGWVIANCLARGSSMAGRPCRSLFEER
jgi:hypothetical protein